ncbi:MAG TPA: PAS domain-containing protein, partial [Acidimicrobiia bacterium]|nr:PAS domain-containing protein [Acidimicrobiia bacterium]
MTAAPPGAALAAERRPATAMLSGDGRVVSCDDGWLSLTAACSAEVLGRPPHDATCYTADRERLERAVAAVVRDGTSASVAHRVERGDGSLAWLHTWLVALPT